MNRAFTWETVHRTLRDPRYIARLLRPGLLCTFVVTTFPRRLRIDASLNYLELPCTRHSLPTHSYPPLRSLFFSPSLRNMGTSDLDRYFSLASGRDISTSSHADHMRLCVTTMCATTTTDDH